MEDKGAGVVVLLLCYLSLAGKLLFFISVQWHKNYAVFDHNPLGRKATGELWGRHNSSTDEHITGRGWPLFHVFPDLPYKSDISFCCKGFSVCQCVCVCRM